MAHCRSGINVASTAWISQDLGNIAFEMIRLALAFVVAAIIALDTRG